MSELGNFYTPGHTTTIRGIGWGEPMDWLPHCTCGWTGITIAEKIGDEFNGDAYREDIKSLIQKHGVSKVFNTPRKAIGVFDDALIQVLQHINWSEDFVSNSIAKLQEKLKETALQISDDLESVDFRETEKSLSRLLKELDQALKTQKVFNKGLIFSHTWDEEVHSIYKKATEEFFNEQNTQP